ncbi:altered inheritance of mitochondria protein 3-like [Salvia miltiorrhiza]|uniref:altered inheritance of mitochondria protein 3-like n=1 Tax=Salvia miltiorrhiza TaxID=226208 RepID=UPI0025AB786C|nr:altered inheritance of mitochondria protein 3-like [Salvia miltiorrhiza]
MNNSTASQYMDKQIMDLSNSQSNIAGSNGGGGADFIDFMNRPAEKKEDMVPSYDFMPIRPATAAAASSSPKAARSNFDSDNDDPPLRTWNSVDSKANSSPIRNYNSVDVDEPAKFVLGKNHKTGSAPLDGTLVSDIERMMKKHMDNLIHAIDNMSSRLSQLETRSRNLEHSIDDLKTSVGNNHGAIDGKMRLLENILTEVQSGVKVVRDKQDIVEAQLQIAKMQLPKAEHIESKINAQPDPMQTGVPTQHQFSNVPLTQAPPALHPPNAPPSPPQQKIQPQVQLPNQFPQNQIPPVSQRDSYFPPPSQTPENPNQQYQTPENPNQQYQLPPSQPQQQQQLSAPPPPQHQYQPPPQPQYSLPPPPSQPHSSFSAVNPSMPQPPVGHHSEEALHMPMPPQNYPMSSRPPPSVPSTGVPPPASQQYFGPTPSVYEPPPTSRPGSAYSGSFGPPSGHGEPYPYGSAPSQYGTSSPMQPQQLSSPSMGQSGGSGYPQLPTARILPQALPTASAVGGGPGSGAGGSGNRVPIDDVVDRVTNMGFSRDQVRATVRKLTENGQAVDLNVVLDKLMNDGDGQGPRGWFGR